jgi:DNA repair protein REV1
MGYADELQAVSVDEALIDVTTAVAARAAAPEEAEEAEEAEEGPEDPDAERKMRDPAVEIAEKIRDEVRALTEGCEGRGDCSRPGKYANFQ